ncbi:MAG TPA: hypothetical protein PKZ16_01050 [bacterium]|nr:hypothetical protein [bacterium]HPL95470.1 hypothetical protein [bacterium]
MKAYWIEGFGICVPYDSQKHLQYICKFMVMSTPDGNIIIAGPQNTHRALMKDAENLLEMLNSRSPRYPLYAGECARGGKINLFDMLFSSDWESVEFGAHTPQNMRLEIVKILGLITKA